MTSLPSSSLTAPVTAGARRRIAGAAGLVVIAGPTALGFFTGGYFESARVWAGLIAWLLVAVAALVSDDPWPRGRPAVVAVAGLALMAGWTLLSLRWAPVGADAYGAGELLVLYLGMLLAAAALIRGYLARRLLEPALAAGVLVVVGYGLAGRLLPGLLHFARSVSASGRLEQPLTYWNAMGELAAIGLVLTIRVAGDAARGRGLRVVALAAAVPLGAGLYASFSRGALFACLSGLIVLLIAAPTRAQLRALLAGVGSAALGALAVAPFSGVTALAGSPVTREHQGAIALVALAVAIALAAVTQHRLVGREPDGSLQLPRHSGVIALGVIVLFLAVAIVAGSKENTSQPLNSGISRLSTLRSDRYAYWRVALHAFAQDPLRGVGAGGWQVYWLRLRPYAEGAVDAHSLEIQTLAELGIVGILLLAALAGGIAQACRRAMQSAPAIAAGPVAAIVVYAVHSPLDWDWQMPAVTLVAIVLAGAMLGLSGGSVSEPAGAGARG